MSAYAMHTHILEAGENHPTGVCVLTPFTQKAKFHSLWSACVHTHMESQQWWNSPEHLVFKYYI